MNVVFISNPFCKYVFSHMSRSHLSYGSRPLEQKQIKVLPSLPASLSVILPLLHWLHHWAESTVMAPGGNPACSWKSSERGSVHVCLRQRLKIHMHAYVSPESEDVCEGGMGCSGCSHYLMQVTSVKIHIANIHSKHFP